MVCLRGVPVFALISDLSAPALAGYVGLDNWKVGRTAAWAISQFVQAPGQVGIFVGSHRYRCQEACEMSFRSYFREHATDFQLLEPRTSLEEARYVYESTLDLLQREPDLVGLFVAGGGIEGVIRALREECASERMFTVGLDLTAETRSGLIDGVLKLVLSHPMQTSGRNGRRGDGARHGARPARAGPADAAAVRHLHARERVIGQVEPDQPMFFISIRIP